MTLPALCKLLALLMLDCLNGAVGAEEDGTGRLAESPAWASTEEAAQALMVALEAARRRALMEQLAAEVSQSGVRRVDQRRRKFITANNPGQHYRDYLSRWSAAVEAAGNAHYPHVARDAGLHGEVILSASIGRDGSVERIDLIRGSGHAVLDKAAIDSVYHAAPFEPVPVHEGIALLVITRTFQFKPAANAAAGP